MRVQAVQPYRYQHSFKAATYDIFTGLKDKMTLLSDVEDQMEKQEDVSIAMFDMDNFKSVNEILGYKAGDEFIKAIGSDISEVAKKRKINAYRFGGDEFVVLVLRGMSAEEKDALVTEVQGVIAGNKVLSGKKDEYLKSIHHLVKCFEGSQHKVEEVDRINGRYEVYQDIFKNSTVAKQDPYVLKSMFLINQQREKLLDRVYSETSPGTTQTRLDEYKEKYDRGHDLYKVRKWYRDFKRHGFHISGGVMTFTPEQYKGKEPIDLINETGELLKKNKALENI